MLENLSRVDVKCSIFGTRPSSAIMRTGASWRKTDASHDSLDHCWPTSWPTEVALEREATAADGMTQEIFSSRSPAY